MIERRSQPLVQIVEVFRRSVRSGKIPHSYIFEGIPGCGRRKARPLDNIEAAISIKKCRVLSVPPQSLSVSDKHRDARAILAAVKHLRRDILVRSKLDLRASPERVLARDQIESIDAGRHGKTGERVKRLRIRSLAAKTGAACFSNSRRVRRVSSRGAPILECPSK